MDIKEFASNFMQLAIEENAEKDFDEELLSMILEYVEGSGDVASPKICFFKKRMASINAYDYNDENDSLDLFILIPTKTILGKISNNEIDKALTRLYHFYEEVISGKITNEIENPNEELAEVSTLIRESVGKVSTLRLFVLTNGLCDYKPSTALMENEMIRQDIVWDIQSIYRQECIMSGKASIDIDFPVAYNTKLQCLKLQNDSPDVDSYLAIIPGNTLAKVYNDYKHALLEKNVRTFLQFKPKVNKEIRKTLLEEPEMFFSYNNGISSTASEIEMSKDGSSFYVTRLVDWQIVNGGQTTGTIASVYFDKRESLLDVFVPMKISVIKDKDKSKLLVDKISQCANSQTNIKKSDFYANDQYLVDLENLSRTEWVRDENMQALSKWYFERTRGQYLDERAQLSSINEKQFRNEYPKKQKLTKTDVAIYVACWNGMPNIACKGSEESYKYFMKEIRTSEAKATPTYYKRLIAKAILFRSIDSMVRKKDLGGYKSNINAYVLASISFLTKGNLDLDYIWQHQVLQGELEYYVHNTLIPVVWEHLIKNTEGISNPSVWSRNSECWVSLQTKLCILEGIHSNLLISSDSTSKDETITQARKEKIEEAWSYPAEVWFSISKWATQNNIFTPMERKQLYNYGAYKSRNRGFSLKQATDGLNLINEAKVRGFEMETNTVNNG